MKTDVEGQPEGDLGDVEVDLPPGLIGNPLTLPRCSRAEFDGTPHCALGTQVGIMSVSTAGIGIVTAPVFNLVPPPGYAAAFGLNAAGNIAIEGLFLVGSGAGAHLRVTSLLLPTGLGVRHVTQTLWGVPADPAHNGQRGKCLSAGGSCPAEVAPAPLLTLPTSCAGPVRTTLTVGSSDSPRVSATATSVFRDASGNPSPLAGCDAVPFEPRLTATTEGSALAPSSFTASLEVAQHDGADLTGAASLGGIEVELPRGLALNPSAGSWLDGCSTAAVGLESAPGVAPAVFDESPVGCPPSSKLGSIALRTPPIDHDLSGSIYLATAGANPFGARYAVYLVIEDVSTGTILKIPGRLEADSADGRLTIVVPEPPPLPIGRLRLEFAGGPRAPLATPPSCGTYSTEATFTPSTAPDGSQVSRRSGFTLASGAWGRSCPRPEAERNAAPSFRAGVEAALAGASSPLLVDLSREDTDQHFGAFDLTLPPGLVANLGSVPTGTPVGSARVEAGVGPQPLALYGTVYLDGPYKGAPYSLAIVVPARVGPFDLGTIVQRAAVTVDPATAQVSVRADPLPRILAGVPLELRGLRLDLDRPGFIRNPTSCEPMAITGSATTSLGQVAPLSERFQVGDCAALPFKPKLALRFSGALGRSGHPAVRAVLRTDPDGAALSSAAFALPAGELLDLRHIRSLCPRGAAADRCPPGSRLGSIRLHSPLLNAPLEGPVFLRVPSHRLPDLSAEVRSGDLHFALRGRTTDRHGRLGVSLGSLPDIPLSKAVLDLAGGRGGIVVNSRSLCSSPGRVVASFGAHSGKRSRFSVRPRLKGRC